MYIYEVSSLIHLHKIRNHFDNYPLESTKLIHYILWCKVMDLMLNKEHLTKQGFIKILSFKAVFPKGLNENITAAFPNVKPITKPEFKPNTGKLNPHWIAGFTQADGTFGLSPVKRANTKLGYNALPQFRITQHERDVVVLNRIILTMGCGILIKPSAGRDRYTINVGSAKDLISIVIPLFEQHPFYGAKSLDFKDFCAGMDIIKNKGHLTKEGIDRIIELARGMNTSRYS